VMTRVRCEDAAGKAVRGIFAEYLKPYLVITFTDDTFVIIGIECYGETIAMDLDPAPERDVDDLLRHLDDAGDIFVTSGVVSTEEMRAHCEAECARSAQEHEQNERRYLARLKAKYEQGEPS
jgi:hypothetical protein